MYGWERLVLLRHLLDEGLTKAAIADRLGVSRRVIYYWLESGQLDRDVTTPLPPRERLKGRPKLEPYKAIIQTRLESYLAAFRVSIHARASERRTKDASHCARVVVSIHAHARASDTRGQSCW